MNTDPQSEGLPRLSAIWAQARGRVIGNDGGMPWFAPSDLDHFKNATSRAPVIMGRPTWESFPERFRPLPHRTNIVLTRSVPAPVDAETGLAQHDGALWTSSLTTALEAARAAPRDGDDLWVIGGSHLYGQVLGLTDLPGVVDGRLARVLVTQLEIDVAGDRTAPELGDEWSVEELHRGIEERGRVADSAGTLQPAAIPYRFLEYTR